MVAIYHLISSITPSPQIPERRRGRVEIAALITHHNLTTSLRAATESMTTSGITFLCSRSSS